MLRVGSPAASAGHIFGRCTKLASELECAREWLQDCLSNHDHGVNVAASPPARLVAVGTEDGSQPIVLIDNVHVEGTYLALSHCWGKSETLRTTRATLDTFRTSIPWDQLPKPFQDALQISRGLGISYVWIDSLCIRSRRPRRVEY
jgi:hypothetical protein